MPAFWGSILEFLVNCLKMVRHVTALTAKAVVNNLSRVRDDDKTDDIVVVSELDSSIYVYSFKLCNIDGIVKWCWSCN